MKEEDAILVNVEVGADSCVTGRGGDSIGADEETSAMRCLEGGGTLPTVGILQKEFMTI